MVAVRKDLRRAGEKAAPGEANRRCQNQFGMLELN
jgi:hypothetical protein